VTEGPADTLSTAASASESEAHVPREKFSALASFVGRYGASSYSMFTEWSSQMDMTITMPFFEEAAILERPPLVWNVFRSPSVAFCAAQKESLMKLPVTPETVD
jgi:hypothetical protein